MTTPDHAAYLDRLKSAVAAAHLELLDEDWRGTHAQYRLRCTAGHVWSRTALQIVNQGPVKCPECRDIGLLARLAAVAEQNGSVCLDTSWRGAHAMYHFRCVAAGHLWERRAADMPRSAVCLQCTRKRLHAGKLLTDGLEQLRAAAAAKGGVCLSETYTTQNVRYRFRCARGHEWEAKGGKVLLGTWCARCAHDALRDNIEVFQAIAAQRGGQCLSKEYRNNNTKLTWMCHKGHIWQAVPSSIKLGGTWCPECAHANRITRAASLARIRYGESLHQGKPE